MKHRIIDLRKLDEHRCLADETIAEAAIQEGCTRIDAALGVATDLGFHVQLEQSGIWWFISAVPDIDNLRLLRTYLRRGPTAAAEYESRLRTLRHCVALTAEDACLALICLLLAPDLDLFIQESEDSSNYRNTYRAPDAAAIWGEWAYWTYDSMSECLNESDVLDMCASFKGTPR
ncbi:MAG: hypothetical protein H7144_18470 [Burkholderiales bacterium]|nr:hypothetical protein [Phycisphaerae bacterium]